MPNTKIDINVGIIPALVEAYTETLKTWRAILAAMNPDQRAAYTEILLKREQWWQENVWEKIAKPFPLHMESATPKTSSSETHSAATKRPSVDSHA